jgi:peptidoglycan hydrolase CwlO-like protein
VASDPVCADTRSVARSVVLVLAHRNVQRQAALAGKERQSLIKEASEAKAERKEMAAREAAALEAEQDKLAASGDFSGVARLQRAVESLTAQNQARTRALATPA